MLGSKSGFSVVAGTIVLVMILSVLSTSVVLRANASSGRIEYSSNTTLSSDVFCTNLTIDSGVTVTTNGFNFYCSGTFDNEGTIVTGNTPLQDFPDSYGGSGGRAESQLCNAATGSGYSTLAPGGQGNSVDHVPTQGGSTPSPPSLTSGLAPSLTAGLILRWFESGMSSFLAGAGGQTVCGDIIGGAGAYGLYLQANQINAGMVEAHGQMGSGTCSARGLSGSGGGGTILFSFGDGGYVSGTYDVRGGSGVPSCDGLSVSGAGGNGQVFTFNHGSPLQPRAPILIDGNANFTRANGVTSGRGTVSHPYIIQGWDIESHQQYGIKIVNTTAYFVVRNGFVDATCADCHYVPASIGILLNHVTNGLIQNMTVEATVADFSPGSNTLFGVEVMEINNSANIVVSNCNVNGIDQFGSGAMPMIVTNSTRITIKDDSLNPGYAVDGLDIDHSTDVIVSGSSIYAGVDSIALHVDDSANLTVSSNLLGGPVDALDVEGSRNIIMTGNLAESLVTFGYSSLIDVESNTFNNTFTSILEIISLYHSSGVRIFHNNFMNHQNQPFDDNPTANTWDNGYPSGGNFWADYTRADNCSGPSQNICPSPDGIGDAPFVFGSVMDNYPLMHPFGPTVAGTVRFSPRVVSLERSTRYLTAIIQLPSSFNASNIATSSIRLNNTLLPVSSDHIKVGSLNETLSVKFDMVQVTSMMSRPGRYALSISANILTSTTFRPFQATATILAFSCECNQS
jgi:hypothetical protein